MRISPLASLESYEAFIYGIRNRFPSVEVSTLVVIRQGKTFGKVQGSLLFLGGRVEVRVLQIVNCALKQIIWYSYGVWIDGELAYWYDPQPHPDDPTLASTHPHHKHVQPDIKRHRIPPPGLSFDQPNLPFLIGEFEALLPALMRK